MNTQTKTIICKNTKDLPSLTVIRELPRNTTLKVIFQDVLKLSRHLIGENWKADLDGFLIGIHNQEPVITISKLITAQEIIEHQAFFEQCAKDYGILGHTLINYLALKLKVDIHHELPYKTFINVLKNHRVGRLNKWEYNFHGYHCRFTHQTTGQQIEVPLIFGWEFGELDPYFFAIFIKTTLKYQPLPVSIYQDFHDGQRILEKMVELGLFENIHSNQGTQGIIVKDRIEKVVKIFSDEEFGELLFS